MFNMHETQQHPAHFVNGNLELLGFGNGKLALIQSVKELAENAIDAIRMDALQQQQQHQPQLDHRSDRSFVRIKVTKTDNQVNDGNYELVCTDTGSGIPTHLITKLCGGIFATSKQQLATAAIRVPKDHAKSTTAITPTTSGKFGIGLKAALLFSQQHLETACLKITTTSSSSEIVYVELRIDPAYRHTHTQSSHNHDLKSIQDAAVVQQVQQFVVDEAHKEFSGTEMRLAFPALANPRDLEHAVRVLHNYFQSLRYTIPQWMGLEFWFHVDDIQSQVQIPLHEEPLTRFLMDFHGDQSDLVFAEKHSHRRNVRVTCMALMSSNCITGSGNSHQKQERKQLKAPVNMEICVLRYANQIPLVNAEDFFLCAITRGASKKSMWKKLGYKCRRKPTVDRIQRMPVHFELVPWSANFSKQCDHLSNLAIEIEAKQLILAIDVSANGEDADKIGNGLRFGCLKKSTLDECYSDLVGSAVGSVLNELIDKGYLFTYERAQQDEMMLECVPLIAKAAASITMNATQHRLPFVFHQHQGEESDDDNLQVLENSIICQLQRIVLDEIK